MFFLHDLASPSGTTVLPMVQRPDGSLPLRGLSDIYAYASVELLAGSRLKIDPNSSVVGAPSWSMRELRSPTWAFN